MTQRLLDTGEQPVEVVGFSEVMAAVVVRWRLVAAVSAIGLVTGVLLAAVLPPRYTAETRFVGAGASRTSLFSGLAGAAGLAGLASEVGVSLGVSGAQMSPQFYVDLLQSREIRESLLQAAFPVAGDSTREMRLLDQLGIRGRTEAVRVDKALRYLKRRISVEAADKSGIVDIRVTLPRPHLAADAANRLIDLLNVFNVDRLQFQSRQQRLFAERRLREAEGELRAAEQDQLRFAERNRSIANSPALQVEAARLQRVIEAKQAVFTTLSRAYEEARIAEARDVPTITVIDRAAAPARRSPPQPWLLTLVGLLCGVVAGVGTAILSEAISRARATVSRAVGRSVRQGRRAGDRETDTSERDRQKLAEIR